MILSSNIHRAYVRLFTLILCVFAPAVCVGANTHFSSQRIKHLVTSLNISQIESDSIIHTKYKAYPIVIESAGDTVVHIGIDIFGPDLKKTNLLIYRFIEQYLLEAVASGNINETRRKMCDEGVVMTSTLNSIPLLTSANDRISLNLSYQHPYRYKVDWSSGDKSFSMSFPSNYQLLSGNNQIELANNFKQLVLSHKINELRAPVGRDTIKISEDIWAVKNGYYIIEQMENVQFFTVQDSPIVSASKDSLESNTPAIDFSNIVTQASSLNMVAGKTIPGSGVKRILTLLPKICNVIPSAGTAQSCVPDSLLLVCNSQHPKETIHNLLSNGLLTNDIKVNLTLRKYGFVSETFECPLSQLIDCGLEQGCVPYIGLEEDKGSKKITAYLMMVQPYYGFNHSFRFIFDKDVLEKMSGTVSATLNAYIPTHNLSTLYGEDKPKI